LRKQNDFSKRKVISAYDAQKFKKLVTLSTPEDVPQDDSIGKTGCLPTNASCEEKEKLNKSPGLRFLLSTSFKSIGKTNAE